jgi:hypothetical protein
MVYARNLVALDTLTIFETTPSLNVLAGVLQKNISNQTDTSHHTQRQSQWYQGNRKNRIGCWRENSPLVSKNQYKRY